MDLETKIIKMQKRVTYYENVAKGMTLEHLKKHYQGFAEGLKEALRILMAQTQEELDQSWRSKQIIMKEETK